MTERETVIKAFEFCLMPPSKKEIEDDICSHEDCPYYREYNGGKCISAAVSDALALLKAQEPVVRCKDCMYWKSDMLTHFWKPCDVVSTEKDWYCPCGKRR